MSDSIDTAIDQYRLGRLTELHNLAVSTLDHRRWQMYQDGTTWTGICNLLDARSPHAALTTDEVDEAFRQGAEYLNVWNRAHPPVTSAVKVPTVDQVAALHSPGFPKPWTQCKFCTGNEDGPHTPNCPGDSAALLKRIQVLESALRELANLNGNQIVRDAVFSILGVRTDE